MYKISDKATELLAREAPENYTQEETLFLLEELALAMKELHCILDAMEERAKLL